MTTAGPEIVPCPACGARNRVTAAQRARTPVCGRCKTPLPLGGDATADGSVLVVTDATFAALVERSPVPVLLDCWAAWCAPCRMIAPTIDRLAAEMAGRARVAKLDVDANPATAGRFRVDSIPTLLVFRGGREVDRIVGLAPAAEIARRLARFAG